LPESEHPWPVLAETYRDASRYSADHLDVKLRAVGRRLVPRGTATESPLDVEEIDRLARMEHDRWWAERDLGGWTYGETRDNVRRIHPLMRPFDDLSEADRDKDRENVRNIMAIAAAEGFVPARFASSDGTDGVVSGSPSAG
jgi:hypothetical protein